MENSLTFKENPHENTENREIKQPQEI